MARYKVIEGSQSSHCCFDWTVVDTEQPRLRSDGSVVVDGGETQYYSVCECFEEESAQLIAQALNG